MQVDERKSTTGLSAIFQSKGFALVDLVFIPVLGFLKRSIRSSTLKLQQMELALK